MQYNYCYGEPEKSKYHLMFSGLLESCDETCANKKMICDVRFMQYINQCEQLQKHFSCSSCEEKFSSYAPSYMLEDDEGVCVLSTDKMLFNCDNKHANHYRACPCIEDHN